MGAARIRADVEALAALSRASASVGERESAAMLGERLREAGAREVRVEPFSFQRHWAWRHGPHLASGLLAAALGGRRGALLALATLASFDADFNGRAPWLRRLAPAGEGANVVGRVPAAGARQRTLVLVAHHDAAQTGLVWRVPALAASIAGRRLARALGSAQAPEDGVDSFASVPELGLLLVAAGGLMRVGRWLRGAGALALGATLALALDVARSPTVPGANDNGSGVAAALALCERFAGDPLPGTDVIVVLTGSEETGLGGMSAWLRGAGRALRSPTTLVIGLDTIGCGEPALVSAEGGLVPVRYDRRDLELAEDAARRVGLPRPRRYRTGAPTDPIVARHAGLRAVSIVSVSGGGFTEYHLPSDTPERIDWNSIDACIALAAALADSWSGRAASGGA
ncbi:MAG: M28 family metallopeptidase [Thermoleophilaceae bacterium]